MDQSTTTSTHYYDGNLQLLEARYLELASSIRALYTSMEEIRDYLEQQEQEQAEKNKQDTTNNNNNNNNDDEEDDVFIDALKENQLFFYKQRNELFTIVKKMNILQPHVIDVPADIQIMVLNTEEGQEEEHKHQEHRDRKENHRAAVPIDNARYYNNNNNSNSNDEEEKVDENDFGSSNTTTGDSAIGFYL